MIRICFYIPDSSSHVGGPAYSYKRIIESVSTSDSIAVIDANKMFLDKKFNSYRKFLFLVFGNFNLMHIFSIWNPYASFVFLICFLRSIPVVISPLGMLQPWALSWKKHKKLFALFTYQRFILNRANALHVTSEIELDAVRSFNFSSSTFLIPHGIDIPLTLKRNRGDIRNALFISRLHPGKGLEDLLFSWKEVAPVGWNLNIAGAGDKSYIRKIQALVDVYGIGNQVRFLGYVSGKEKVDLFQSSELVIAPSYGENFGFVVPEALSFGVPVITSNMTPWAWVSAKRCGWCIDMAPGSLAMSLREATLTSRDELDKMGMRGRKYLGSTYEWPQVGLKHLKMYKEILEFESMEKV